MLGWLYMRRVPLHAVWLLSALSWDPDQETQVFASVPLPSHASDQRPCPSFPPKRPERLTERAHALAEARSNSAC